MQLSKTQLKTLRSLCHDLRPVVIVGQNGLSNNVHAEITQALKVHELIKIKLAGSETDARQALIDQILSQNKADLVLKIGKIVCIFKRNPQNIRIELGK